MNYKNMVCAVVTGLCLMVLSSGSVSAAEVGEVSADQILISRESAAAGKVEVLTRDTSLNLTKGECVHLYVNDEKGKRVPLDLDVAQGEYRIQMKKKPGGKWEICGRTVTFTEPETKVRFKIGDSSGMVSAEAQRQGTFNVTVEPEKVDFDFSRVGEGTISLYWGILLRFPGDPNQQGNEAYNYAREIEKGGINAYVRNAEIIAQSDEFQNYIFKRNSPEELVDHFYWRFLGITKPTRDAQYNRMLDFVKKGKSHLAVSEIITSKDYIDRIRRNDFFRNE